MDSRKLKEMEEKIHKLAGIIVDNDENGLDSDHGKLIHPDFIKALESLAELQETGSLDSESMTEMNELYAKHTKIHEGESVES